MRRYQVPLLHFLLRGLPQSDAEDILQDTFVRAYSRLELYNPKWHFKTWIFTIANRLRINHYRRPTLMNETPDTLINYPAADDVTRSLIDSEQKAHIWDIAKGALTQDQYAAMWLFYVEELPVGQIARILDRSWVSVKTMLHRARKRLKPLLAEKMLIENGEKP